MACSIHGSKRRPGGADPGTRASARRLGAGLRAGQRAAHRPGLPACAGVVVLRRARPRPARATPVGQPGVVGGGHPHRRRRAGPGRRHRSLCGTPAFGGEVDHQLAAHHLQNVRPAAGDLDDVGPSTSRRTPTSPAAPPCAELSVAGINENRTLACDDNPVSVSGVSNTVVITGHCTGLSVSGVQNTVTVEAVASTPRASTTRSHTTRALRASATRVARTWSAGADGQPGCPGSSSRRLTAMP